MDYHIENRKMKDCYKQPLPYGLGAICVDRIFCRTPNGYAGYEVVMVYYQIP